MKIIVTLKDPDGFSDAIDEAVDEQLNDLSLDEDEKDELRDIKREKISDALEKWVEYDECVTIEFDTEAGTATVLPNKD